MWWSRIRVLSRALLAGALALAGCGFAPAYGPAGQANALSGRIALYEPQNRDNFLLVQRLEDRLGRSAAASMALDVALSIGTEGLGVSSQGNITRFRLLGSAAYVLRDGETQAELTSGAVTAFTGYSTTGTTVAALAAESDARERLMTILADQIIDRLILAAPGLPR